VIVPTVDFMKDILQKGSASLVFASITLPFTLVV